MKVVQSKKRRIQEREAVELEKKLKQQKDRAELRKIHEKLRQAKIAQMLGNQAAEEVGVPL